MKPFDLEQALAGKPVVTRSGLPVTELYFCKTAMSAPRPLIVVINGGVYSYTKDGRSLSFSPHDYDLFMADEKKTVWIGIRKKDLNTTGGKETEENVRRTISACYDGNIDTDWKIIQTEIEV